MPLLQEAETGALKADLNPLTGRLLEGQEPPAGVGIKYIPRIGYVADTGLDFGLEYFDAAIKNKRVNPNTGVLEDADGWNTYSAGAPSSTLLLAPKLEIYYACYKTLASARFLAPWTTGGATRNSATPPGSEQGCAVVVSILAEDEGKLFIIPYGAAPTGANRDPYEVDTAKRKQVVDANAPAYLETNTDYYGKVFVDEVYGPGRPAKYECLPSAPATADGVTVWKWFRSDIL
jgi:hypothetical protein